MQDPLFWYVVCPVLRDGATDAWNVGVVVPAVTTAVTRVEARPTTVSFASPTVKLHSKSAELAGLSVTILGPSTTDAAPGRDVVTVRSFQIVPGRGPTAIAVVVTIRYVRTLYSLLAGLQVPFRTCPGLHVLFLILGFSVLGFYWPILLLLLYTAS